MTDLIAYIASLKDLRERREIALALLWDSAETPTSVARKLGCHRSAIYQWLKRYKETGKEGLISSRGAGAPSKLSGVQKKYIFDVLTRDTPEKHDLPYGLWTLSAIQELVLKSAGVELSKVSVGRLIKMFGISLSKSVQYMTSYLEDQKATDSWLKEESPSILKQARKARATIYFGNIYNIYLKRKNTCHARFKMLRSGRYPLFMYSAVSSKGKIQFLFIKGQPTASKIINFFERLLSNSENILIIIDNYHGVGDKNVNDFITSTQGKLNIITPPFFE
jgi:transposase